jgi:hypothetical protein
MSLPRKRVFRIGGDVGDLDRPALERDAPGDRPTAGGDRVGLHECLIFRREADCRCRQIHFAVAAQDERDLRLAQSSSGLGDRL